MNPSPYSSTWHRVAQLKPALKPHATIVRQVYRGEVWYVINDAARDQYLRFTPEAFIIINSLRGNRTVAEIWQHAVDQSGDKAPTQDQVIQLIGQLHAADLLQSSVAPDAGEVARRARRFDRRQWLGKIANPLAMQFHLINPDRWLTGATAALSPLLGWTGFLSWVCIVGYAGVLGSRHWRELTYNWSDQLFSLNNVGYTTLAFVVMKVLHELGHGLIAKRFGSRVYSMGVSLLLFAPVPYVDASSSWAFTSKFERALVAAGGMLVELLLAAIAMLLWLELEPGAARSVAYYVVMVGSVSTLLFNANPLLRFDGYFIFADLFELPNLRNRANQYVFYFIKRFIVRDANAQRVHVAPGEAKWLAGYWIAAGLFRISITIAIFLWLLDLSPALGLVLAAVTLYSWLLKPAWHGWRYMRTQRDLGTSGRAVFRRSVLATLVSVALLCAMPLPFRTLAQGVIWLPEDAFIRAETDGFVADLPLADGAQVLAGATVMSISNPARDAELQLRRAEVKELEIRRNLELTRDAANLRLIEETLKGAQQQLEFAEREVARQAITARRSGTLVLLDEADLPGRHVQQGALIGYVLNNNHAVGQAAVSQHDIQLMQNNVQRVELRVPGHMGDVYSARILRINPAAQNELPSAALTTAGGGRILADPEDPAGISALTSHFIIEVELPDALQNVKPGTRFHARFDQGYLPLAMQLYRGLQQLFLRHLPT